ncbi:MAG: DUF86 domain-containing protein [Chloroflexi bacterium]|nr:DUF86 domain-containing protein [Chloroflexota bacterium]
MSEERDVGLFVQDMLTSIEKVESYLAGVDANGFEGDSLLQDAVFRRLEIVGEAAKHIPPAVRERHPDIPWQKVAGLRDVLIHRYHGIIVAQVWKIVTVDLPAVKKQLVQVQTDLEHSE